ncbi:unnamed protein product [Symbiodinium sp. CCMP2592]|nr:unnamed protein product [Symbiodinium sp. CCMP2592]
MDAQQWDVICLTDLKYPDDGTREYRYNGRDWYMVVLGRVGFLLSDVWYTWWEQGGAITYQRNLRAAAIGIPRRGWRRGVWLCAAYAPTSAAGRRVRAALRQDVTYLVEAAPPSNMIVVAGDLNAELWNNQDAGQVGNAVVGSFSHARLTTAGEEWRDWCVRYDFRDAGSRYQQRRRCTWSHPRFRTDHELDHFLIRHRDIWHLQSCRILYDGPNVDVPWTPYTDHNPVECILRVGKWWAPKTARNSSAQRPDLDALRGSGPTAVELREKWQALVERRLRDLRLELEQEPNATQKWKTVCRICRSAALEVCGILVEFKGAPWLQQHAREALELDAAIREAKLRDEAARAQEDPQVAADFRRRLQATRREKTLTVRRWKEAWLRDRAHAADALIGTPDAFGVFKIVKQILGAVKPGKKDGGRKRASTNAEVDAWKEHFARIQAGKGEVPERVWEDVAGLEEWTELNDEPTWEEMQRAIREMKTGKAGGDDRMLAEFLKWSGLELQRQMFRFITDAWQYASTAEDGRESEHWPKAWKEGTVVPFWKRKGNWKDKNTWRGITLLSVGSKLLARICAQRLSRWSQNWMNPLQFGFRPGSGVDDAQQITRSILEETAQSAHSKVYVLRFFDLEKAYPKVSRPSLWTALQRKGCPRGFLKVLKGIHEDPSCKVRFQGKVSGHFIPERGLREGCPSSPILFNVFHHCVMEVFRARRGRKALSNQHQPGLDWVFKVDGKVAKRKTDREEEGRNIKRVCIGDFAYADDTGIVGEAEEARAAETIFTQTVEDFAGKVNTDKTEGLRVASTVRAPTDVPWLGEGPTVKHLGTLLAERAGHAAETHRCAQKAASRVVEISGAWLRGRTKQYKRKDLSTSTRIRVLKSVVKGTLMSFSRTRSWQTNQISRMQDMAIRRSLGYRLKELRQAGITNEVMRNLVQWEKFDSAVRRASLLWLGHVARMPAESPQKQIMFGWVEGHKAKMRCPFKQAQEEHAVFVPAPIFVAGCIQVHLASIISKVYSV